MGYNIKSPTVVTAQSKKKTKIPTGQAAAVTQSTITQATTATRQQNTRDARFQRRSADGGEDRSVSPFGTKVTEVGDASSGNQGILSRQGVNPNTGRTFQETVERPDIGEISLTPEKRDIYLSGSHGLTSYYPNIILTTHRNLSPVGTTPVSNLLIDLNGAIKKAVEYDASEALRTFSSTLGINTDTYDQNIQNADEYSNLCLIAATDKDRLIQLFGIEQISSSPTRAEFRNENPIGGAPYDFLTSIEDVKNYLISYIASNYPTFLFDTGTNTQKIAQLLKTYYYHVLYGALEFEGDAPYENGQLPGFLPDLYTDAISDLKEISPDGDQAVKFSRTFNQLGTASISISNMISLVRLVSRDLVIQSKKDTIESLYPSGTIQNTAANIVGQYRNAGDTVVGFAYNRNNPFNQGANNVSDVINLFNVVQPVFVKIEPGENFGKLDVGPGTDYLVYNELTREGNNTRLDVIDDFNSLYRSFAQKLYGFNSIVASTDDVRLSLFNNMCALIMSFANTFDGANDNDGSIMRMGYLIRAVKDDSFANKLFRFICARDKKKNIPSNATQDYKNKVQQELDTSGDNLFKQFDEYEFSNSGYKRWASYSEFDTGEEWDETETVDVEKNHQNEDGSTSFDTFHKTIRQTEDDLRIIFENQNRSLTSYGLSLTRDARAYVIYKFFLKLLGQLSSSATLRPSVGDNEISVSYKTYQFRALKSAIDNRAISPSAYSQKLNDAALVEDILSNELDIFRVAARYYHQIFHALYTQINLQDQICYDLVNIFVNHAYELTAAANKANDSIAKVNEKIISLGIDSEESLLNAIQREQAYLKKHIVSLYSNPLRGAQYLPSAVDYTQGQAQNVKTMISCVPELADAIDVNNPGQGASNRKYLITVGIPSGLIEKLRYESTGVVSEHMISVNLKFRNLQRKQIDYDAATMQDIDPDTFISKSYKFSTRLFIEEGSQAADSSDIVASTMTNADSIYARTTYKVFDDAGSYKKVDYRAAVAILGDAVVKQHVKSHYANLILQSCNGVNVREHTFNLIPQNQVYPDPVAAGLPDNYSTLIDLITPRFGTDAEALLYKQRVEQDLARSRQFSPNQHLKNMTTSKTYERIFTIPVDFDALAIEFPDDFARALTSDFIFFDVVAEVSLEAAQPPIVILDQSRTRPSRQSDYNVATQSARSLIETSIDQLDVTSAGINSVIEVSNKFRGIFGGSR